MLGRRVGRQRKNVTFAGWNTISGYDWASCTQSLLIMLECNTKLLKKIVIQEVLNLFLYVELSERERGKNNVITFTRWYVFDKGELTSEFKSIIYVGQALDLGV